MKQETSYNNRKMMALGHVAHILSDDHENKEQNLMSIERFIGISNKPYLEDEALAEIVTGLGNTPLAEPALYEFIENKDMDGILEHVQALEGNEELDFEDMDIKTVSDFVNAIRYQVASCKDNNGEYKVTKKLMDIKVPTLKTFKAVEKLREEEKTEEIDPLLIKISGLKFGEDPSEAWEKELFLMTQLSYINKAKVTPFSGF